MKQAVGKRDSNIFSSNSKAGCKVLIFQEQIFVEAMEQTATAAIRTLHKHLLEDKPSLLLGCFLAVFAGPSLRHPSLLV